jgi:hypothetical protein
MTAGLSNNVLNTESNASLCKCLSTWSLNVRIVIPRDGSTRALPSKNCRMFLVIQSSIATFSLVSVSCFHIGQPGSLDLGHPRRLFSFGMGRGSTAVLRLGWFLAYQPLVGVPIDIKHWEVAWDLRDLQNCVFIGRLSIVQIQAILTKFCPSPTLSWPCLSGGRWCGSNKNTMTFGVSGLGNNVLNTESNASLCECLLVTRTKYMYVKMICFRYCTCKR